MGNTVRVQVPPPTPYADVAELADALDSGSSGRKAVGVQIPLSAPEDLGEGLPSPDVTPWHSMLM